MKSIMDLIKGRRSIRKYKAEQITAEELAQILEAGRFAPSGHNVQQSHFVVIQNPAVLDELRAVVSEVFAAMELPEDNSYPNYTQIRLAKKGNYNFMYNPATFIIAANKRSNRNAQSDATLAIGNMMLMAHELQVGSCWINQLGIGTLGDSEKIKDALEKIGIGRDEFVCGALAIGYADQPAPPAKAIEGNRVDYIR